MMRERGTRLVAKNILISILVVFGVFIEASWVRGEDEVISKVLAEEIIQSSGVKGGLCVHLGCGDGKLTTELAIKGRFLVHGLAQDKASVERARQYIQSQGLYGQVSVGYGSLKSLPYIENLVNLVVADDLAKLLRANFPIKEIIRVLTPNGVAYLGQPASSGITINEEELKKKLSEAGLKESEIIRRDGTWVKIRKPRPENIDEWTHLRHGPEGNTVAQDNVVGLPAHLQWIAGPTWGRSHAIRGSFNAIVTANGRIFYIYDEAPRGVEGPICLVLLARDAYNGLLLWKRAAEGLPILKKGEKGFYQYKRRTLVSVGDRVYTVLKKGGPLLALDAATGEIVKTYSGVDLPLEEVVYYQGSLVLSSDVDEGWGPIWCLEAETGRLRWRHDKDNGRYIVVSDGGVFFVTRNEVISLDLTTGQERWRQMKPEGADFLNLYSEGILFLGHRIYGKEKGVHAVSARDGKHLWSYRYKHLSDSSDTDIYHVGGLLWVQGGGERWAMIGIDPKSGAEKRRVDFPEGYQKGRGHHRCYPNKATTRYFLLGTSGIDFVDWQSGKVYDMRYYRGCCQWGILPANGLLYTPPNPCECKNEVYLRGFLALASARDKTPEEKKIGYAERFEQGPAFGKTNQKPETRNQKSEWPTYRHDPQRSGSTKSEVSPNLKLLWDKKVASRVSSPVVAEGMVFVALPDAHQVCAFEARSGEPCWSYTVDGRVDSPPTIYEGLCLFGGRDGWVYCLRATDGELVWRFRAAPEDRLIGAFDQLESAWPVSGSVLIHGGIAFFAAGRNSELDGGMYVYGADPQTGKIIWEEHPTGCKNDILVSDSKDFIAMRRVAFDPRTGKIGLPIDPYLCAGSDMLDNDSWIGRVSCSDSRARAELLVFDQNTSYGVLNNVAKYRMTKPGMSEYKLFAKGAQEWSQQVPLRITAMALAGETLFVAGLPDIIDPDDYWAAFGGKKGGVLWAFSATDGKKLNDWKLEARPVFDGLAAAYGRLYISTQDGRLLCFEGI